MRSDWWVFRVEQKPSIFILLLQIVSFITFLYLWQKNQMKGKTAKDGDSNTQLVDCGHIYITLVQQ